MALRKKGEDIHQLSDRELDSALHDIEEKLFRLKYSHSTVKMKNPLQIRALRRRVARLKTEERLREIQGQVSGSKESK